MCAASRENGVPMGAELSRLLIDFATESRGGARMAGADLEKLTNIVRERLLTVLDDRPGHYLHRDPFTKHIRWRRLSEMPPFSAERTEALRNAWDGDAVLELMATLDRLLSEGMRRSRTTDEIPRARLAEQTDRLLKATGAIADPIQLIDDCIKHAIYDFVHTTVRRLVSGARPRARRAPRVRGHDARRLLGRHRSPTLLACAGEASEDLAFCVAFEYSRGGVDRAVVRPFETLAIGTATLAAVFDAIDLRFEDSDRALAARPRGTTRARPARVKGIVATAFAEVLERVGLALRPASLSKTYGRLRQRVDAVLAETDRAEPDPGSGRKQRGREPR